MTFTITVKHIGMEQPLTFPYCTIPEMEEILHDVDITKMAELKVTRDE